MMKVMGLILILTGTMFFQIQTNPKFIVTNITKGLTVDCLKTSA